MSTQGELSSQAGNVVSGPLVSAVIPFYNRTELTIRAVKSVLAQTYSNFEILAVNDGSTEDDSALAKFFSSNSKITYIKLEANLGRAEARNFGIRSSKGQYIAFLDSDDTWEREKLEVQMGEMLRNGWHFSHTSFYRHDARTGQTRLVRSGSRDYAFPMIAFYSRIVTPSVMLDKNILSGLSFRPDLKFAEDGLLWLLLSKRTILHGIDRPLTNVFIGHQTDALNKAVQIGALQIAKEGLAGHPLYLALHAVFRIARRIQLEIIGLWR